MSRPLRHTRRPLPLYRHIPCKTPHPTRHPEGHSYGRTEQEPPSLLSVDWWECRDYLYGVDLFNHAYWWECHEAFEGLWLASGRTTPSGQCLQTLIQCAVVHLKTDIGNVSGARKLLVNASRHAHEAGTTNLGIDLQVLLDDTQAYANSLSGGPAVLRLIFPSMTP